MRLLLDTNALIWWLEDNPKLGQRARALIADARTEVFASTVSLWEIAIRRRVGKLPVPATRFAQLLAEQNVILLGIELAHLEKLEDLPFHHSDPYAHMLLVQAGAEGAILMTSDQRMTEYGVRLVGVR